MDNCSLVTHQFKYEPEKPENLLDQALFQGCDRLRIEHLLRSRIEPLLRGRTEPTAQTLNVALTKGASSATITVLMRAGAKPNHFTLVLAIKSGAKLSTLQKIVQSGVGECVRIFDAAASRADAKELVPALIKAGAIGPTPGDFLELVNWNRVTTQMVKSMIEGGVQPGIKHLIKARERKQDESIIELLKSAIKQRDPDQNSAELEFLVGDESATDEYIQVLIDGGARVSKSMIMFAKQNAKNNPNVSKAAVELLETLLDDGRPLTPIPAMAE